MRQKYRIDAETTICILPQSPHQKVLMKYPITFLDTYIFFLMNIYHKIKYFFFQIIFIEYKKNHFIHL